MRPIIRVEKLSKQYRIGGPRAQYGTLRDSLAGALRSSVGRLKSSARRRETIWALKDVSFEVKPGELLGIIGRNGSGKSTLLKILSRVTEPTCGGVDLYGRVGSLLEIGAGFHMELTGGENIYLYGAILGMRRAEIQRKFDEIVGFAEMDRFISTPVKYYSTGMYMRLAFAVAAHLDPEILVIDEVLAVGDAAFQKKCLGKMDGVAREGRTVLFVSHNTTALQSLCKEAIWLEDGALLHQGPCSEVVPRYLKKTFALTREQTWDDRQTGIGSGNVRLRSVRVMAGSGDQDEVITVRSPIRLAIEYWNSVPDTLLNVSLFLYDNDGTCVLNSLSDPEIVPAGLLNMTCHIPEDLLNDSRYRLRLMVLKNASVPLLDCDNAASFDVHDIERNMSWYGKWAGVVRPRLTWTSELLMGSGPETDCRASSR